MSKLNRSIMYMFIIWLLIVPPGMIYLFINYLPQEVNWIYIILFMLFAICTVAFPVIRNGRPIFLVMWVTLPAFLLYGIVVEVILMQISCVLMLFAYKSPVRTIIRYFFNSTLYFILSISSAAVFHIADGIVGSLDFWPIIIAACWYQFTHLVLNDLLLKIYAAYSKNRSPYFSNDFFWDYSIAFLLLPFSLVLYFLIDFVGVGTFALLGIPYFSTLLIFKLYNNSEKINDNLRQAGEIGHGLSNNLTEEKVLKQFVEKSAEMFNAEYAYLFDHKDGWLELLRSYEVKGFSDTPSISSFSSSEEIAGAVLTKNKAVIYKKQEEWKDVRIKNNQNSREELQSVLCVPISRNKEIEGVLFLSTTKKDAFEHYQLQILDILCSYFTVAVEKARYVEEKIKTSQRCILTNLYNFVHFEECLDLEMTNLKMGVLNNVSVLMLDIDYFKSVNDTYGHQSGNDILSEMGTILKNLVPEQGIVARYGGEEFIYLLPNTTKKEALILAEKIRMTIEKHAFQITPDLGMDRSITEINITVSIGVSTALEDTDEAKMLLRNADRSLYLGAKQAGRNRVAGYAK